MITVNEEPPQGGGEGKCSLMSMIEVEKLTRDYGAGKGVFDLTFSAGKGEAFGFLGPNGAGKTTTIRHLMGFLRCRSGSCRIGGRDCWKERDVIQEKVGYIPGEIHFFEDMTGTEFLRFLRWYRGVGVLNREKELLEYFELNPEMKIRRMSKGMKQKLGITAALMHDPAVLILDEPTSGLDPLMQNRFIELLRSEKKRGKTILLSSHMFEEVERICDTIGILRQGRLAEVDSVANLRKRHIHSYTVTLETEELARAFAKDFEGRAEGRQATVSAKQSLEDIFMHYYGGDQDDSRDTVQA